MSITQPTNQSINQSIRICATCWQIVGKKKISRKGCVNSPERLLCLFLVYRLQETWLWGTVQRRPSEKRRTAIKTISERTDDNWISSTSPSLRPLTMRQRRWKGFASSLPLLCKSVPRHPAPRLRLYELSQFCWHTHFSPCGSDVRNRLTEKYEQDRHRRKQRRIPYFLTHTLVFFQSHPALASFNVTLHHAMWGKKSKCTREIIIITVRVRLLTEPCLTFNNWAAIPLTYTT